MLRKVLLVTGGAGFIGSEFVRQAVKTGRYRVCVVDALTYAGDKERLREVNNKVSFYQADICDQNKISRIFKQVKPSYVVHFAAETHVDRSILQSDLAVKTNVLGTQVLLESAHEVGLEKFIYISTDEVYGEISKGQFFENTPLKPSSPYSVGKASGDMLTSAFVRTYKFPAVIVRPSNNYGPWQYPEKLIPVVIYKALNNQRIPVYGKGRNIREWLHVSDCARGVMAVLTKGKVGEVYNLGSGAEEENIFVVKVLLDLLKKPHHLIEFIRDRPGHDLRYSLNCSKIRRELGWSPRLKFEDGMESTAQFYVDHYSWLKKKVKSVQSLWKQVYKA